YTDPVSSSLRRVSERTDHGTPIQAAEEDVPRGLDGPIGGMADSSTPRTRRPGSRRDDSRLRDMVAPRFVRLGFGPEARDYEEVWAEQRRLHAQRVAGEVPDTVLLLEHQPVYTAGKRTEPHERPFDGTPVIDVDRGGKITWHGPGQLVGYPIAHLPGRRDVIAHVRRLEEMMIRVAADVGVTVTRVPGRSGIWVPGTDGERDRKLGQIGIRVSRDVAMHGFSLNVNCDLSWTQTIVPCGIPDADVSTLAMETGRDLTVADILPSAKAHLTEVMTQDLPLTKGA